MQLIDVHIDRALSVMNYVFQVYGLLFALLHQHNPLSRHFPIPHDQTHKDRLNNLTEKIE